MNYQGSGVLPRIILTIPPAKCGVFKKEVNLREIGFYLDYDSDDSDNW